MVQIANAYKTCRNCEIEVIYPIELLGRYLCTDCAMKTFKQLGSTLYGYGPGQELHADVGKWEDALGQLDKVIGLKERQCKEI